MRADAAQTTAVQATEMPSRPATYGAATLDGATLDTPLQAGHLPVLICDDRPDVRRELCQVLQLRSPGAAESVGAGSDLLNTYEARSPIQVMIGIHPGSTFGLDALDLLLARHPTASPVVYGSRCDIELLARVYARGAAGLLLWELRDH